MDYITTRIQIRTRPVNEPSKYPKYLLTPKNQNVRLSGLSAMSVLFKPLLELKAVAPLKSLETDFATVDRTEVRRRGGEYAVAL